MEELKIYYDDEGSYHDPFEAQNLECYSTHNPIVVIYCGPCDPDHYQKNTVDCRIRPRKYECEIIGWSEDDDSHPVKKIQQDTIIVKYTQIVAFSCEICR